MAAYRCPVCGYVYDEADGEPREGFPAGTAWSEVPDDWTCPDCAVREKIDFEAAERRMTKTAGRPTHAEASRALLRESVLDAVGGLLADDTWSGVTMGEVASAAGVSRQTVYNTFGGRDELAQAYLLRESERFLDAVDEAIRANAGDAREALRSAAGLFLSLASSHPMIRAVASGDNDDLVALATTRGGLLLTTMTARLADRIERTWPGVDPAGALAALREPGAARDQLRGPPQRHPRADGRAADEGARPVHRRAGRGDRVGRSARGEARRDCRRGGLVGRGRGWTARGRARGWMAGNRPVRFVCCHRATAYGAAVPSAATALGAAPLVGAAPPSSRVSLWAR